MFLILHPALALSLTDSATFLSQCIACQSPLVNLGRCYFASPLNMLVAAVISTFLVLLHDLSWPRHLVVFLLLLQWKYILLSGIVKLIIAVEWCRSPKLLSTLSLQMLFVIDPFPVITQGLIFISFFFKLYLQGLCKYTSSRGNLTIKMTSFFAMTLVSKYFDV